MISGLIDHLWQSTIFAGVAWLVTLALRRNRAQVRYWVWLTASVKFLVPFSLLVGLAELAPKHTARPMVQTEWVVAVEEVARPLAVVPIATPRADRDYSMVLWLAWALGFGVMLTSFGRKWTRMHATVRAARPAPLDLPIPVRTSTALYEPGVFGAFRPILLLPEGIAEKLTPRQLQAIIAHELCHVRRRDNLTAAIHMAVQSIFWLHPLLWWIGARLIDERERACDEEVLRLGSAPQDYAEGILNVCKLYIESPVACVSGVTGSNLKKRIEAIIRNRAALRLSLAKKLALTVAAIGALTTPIVIGVFNVPSVRAQSSIGTTPKWEVVSIRPTNDCLAGSRGGTKGGDGGSTPPPAPSPGRLNSCSTVMSFIDRAYVAFADGHVRSADAGMVAQVEGGPAWINSAHYRINAKAEGTPSQTMMSGPMMQAILEDRFKVKTHREIREVPAYALTVAKGGLKLKPLQGTCIPHPWEEAPRTPDQLPCGLRSLPEIEGSNRTVDIHGYSLDEFAVSIWGSFNRPVVNKTGIVGKFDFYLKYAPDEATPGDFPAGGGDRAPREATASDPGPSIFTALQEQLGLKLEPAKGPREFLVIDSVERPSEN